MSVTARQTAPIIDAHVHIWQHPHTHGDRIWHRPHPIEELLATLDGAGVTAAIQVTPSPERWDNRYGLQCAAAHEHRLRVFGRIDPDACDPARRLRAWMRQPGAVGVRLTSFGQGARQPLAPEEFWAACEQLGVPVALFAPDGLREAVDVLERHPSLRLIVDHLGLGVYPGCSEPLRGLALLPELAVFDSVFVKISGLVEVSREGFPFRDVRDHLAFAVDTFGSDRLIWGSNYPVMRGKCSYEEGLRYLHDCDFLSEADLHRLLGGTITQLLERGATAR